MLFCPKCGTRNKSFYKFCYRCGNKLKFNYEDIKPKEKKVIEFKVNNYITLKLEKSKTVIYVNKEKFLQCKYLLIEIPKESLNEYDNIDSIDDVSEKLDHSLEKSQYRNLTPEIEFWGHCSNLQTWAENNYDTTLLHSNLAFPLLKKLTDVGDPKAKRVFKDEVAERLTSGKTVVAQYLIQDNYIEYFNEEETDFLMDYFFENIRSEFVKEQGTKLDHGDIFALMSLIQENLRYSKILLLDNLIPISSVNNVSQLNYSFESGRITGIGFNKCGLRKFPSSIGMLSRLEKIYLTKNFLKSVPNSIGNLNLLKELNLSDNHLRRLPDTIGNLQNLKELQINHNNIRILPDTISMLKKLEVLSIWGNQLENLPKSMESMDSLRVLGLSFNKLTDFDDVTIKLDHLETLDLSNNRIKNLEGKLESLSSLKSLWLNNNPLKELPESLLELNSLKDLYLINTPVGILPDTRNLKIMEVLEQKDANVWR